MVKAWEQETMRRESYSMTIVKREENPRLITSSELPTATPPAYIEGAAGMAMDNSREVMGGRWEYVY